MKEYKIDLTGYIKSKVLRRTMQLIHKWAESKGIKDVCSDKIKISQENIPNWSCPTYTIRYDSQLVLRRFPEDLNGTAYRFEVYY